MNGAGASAPAFILDSERGDIYTSYIMNTASISLPKNQLTRFRSAAVRYGISPDALIRKIVAEATRVILTTPEETLDEYDNPQEVRRALQSAIRADKKGGLLRTLPATLRSSR